VVDRLVLVIDDDEDIRNTLQETLEDEGYRVLTAADGSEGLGVLDHLQPNLVLLDLFMPGMDGFHFLKVARETGRLATVPIVAVSAGDGSNARAVLQEGATRYLSKPLKLDRLLEVVRELS
jgi:two-component system OmpR family response regulator/two-component system alkaline phosphatase synthesis response regulator PhoP